MFLKVIKIIYTVICQPRTKEALEIIYCSAPVTNMEDKTYFVKLYMKKDGDTFAPDFKKSSPEIKTAQDMEDVLATINSAIIKMGVKPAFFPTGVIQENKVALKM